MSGDNRNEADRNREIVLTWLEALVTADVEAALSLMHDDFRYWLGGNIPVSGWHDREGFLGTTKVLGDAVAGPETMKLGDVVAEGDRVLIEAESDMPLSNGGRYNNYYVMATRVRDGKVVEFKEYADTLHTYQAIDHEGTRGPSKERESPITSVTRTLSGHAGEMKSS
jgi:ketosteroid isomerase-like protein